MVFSSATFLFVFLPLVVGLVHAVPDRLKNGTVLAASLVFYTWGSGGFVLVLIVTSAIDHRIADRAHRAWRRGDEGGRRRALTASVLLNLGVLAYYKYAGFLAVDLVARFTPIADPPAWLTDIALPIGISFFTFQRISYAVDVARGHERPADSVLDHLLYIALFPQLIAGPIVRYGDIAEQLRRRSTELGGVADGAVRFTFGLSKKVLIADTLAPLADQVFGADPGSLSSSAVLLGTLAYTLQLYFDFSGYSDMAIGLGQMIGFRLPENFDRPYTSASVTEFWRRWHITLSRWFRDYLYIPLGGNRTRQTYRNLIIVFLLTGLWHGAAWTFVAWGAYHGSLLLLERRLGWAERDGAGNRAVTLTLVMIGWIIFRAPDLGAAGALIGRLAALDFGPPSDDILVALDTRTSMILCLASIVFLLPGRGPANATRVLTQATRSGAFVRAATLIVALPLSLIVASSQAFSPFLYFQF